VPVTSVISTTYGLLGRARMLHCRPKDFETAAVLNRQCRRGGETVRRVIDCLIGAVAIREGLAIQRIP